jgi:DNA-binding IclR family transcriptional regulator
MANDTMPRTGKPSARHVSAVERAARIVDVLAESGSDLGTNEVARRVGIHPSSASRLLSTLAAAKLVQHVEETGRYRLGLRFIELGNAALARFDLRQVAHPHLTMLVGVTGETATLSVPTDPEAVTVDFVQSSSSVQSVAQLGRRSVPHATATGKVFLAHGGTLPARSLAAHTDRTITDRKELAEEIARVREQGWAQAVGEREIDLNAIAAPIMNGAGELKAIVSLQGPAGRFDRRAMRSALRLLLERASRIGAELPGARLQD